MPQTETTATFPRCNKLPPRPNVAHMVRVAVWFADQGRMPTAEEFQAIAEDVGLSTRGVEEYLNVARCRKGAATRFNTSAELEAYLGQTGSKFDWREIHL